MTFENTPSSEIPEDWDRLNEPPESEVLEDEEPVDSGIQEPPVLLLVASAWGDLVCLLAMSAGILLALVICGYAVSTASLPWMLALAAAWWACSSAILVLVRRGTPGMLLAGIVFSAQVAPHRLARVVGAATFLAFLAGIPALLGPRASLLRLASGQPLSLA
jgi:hypothetical protein